MTLRHLLAALLFCVAIPASASNAPTAKDMSVQQFLAYHDDVARRATTKDFEALSKGEKEKLAAAQADIRQALAGKASMDELDDAAKLTVFNAHEQVLALVNKAENERMVCVQKKRLGSHRHQLECRTVAQINEDREAARNARMRTGTCDPGRSACGGGG